MAAVTIPGAASATTTAAVPAVKFYTALGVNAQTWYTNNTWPQRLAELGIVSVRAKLGTNKDYISKLGPFFANGGKVVTRVTDDSGSTLNRDTAVKSLAFLKNYVGLQRISGIEGPNEFNRTSTRPTDWASYERDYIHWLHDTVRADPAFRAVPLIGPSVWMRTVTDYQALGDLSAWIDRPNIHYYTGGKRPTQTTATAWTMVQAMKDASMLAQGRPIWMTETGWMNGGNIPVSQRAQAKYLLRDYFDAFGTGVEQVFDFQLMDNDNNLYGITDSSARPKLAFYALKNLAALVKDTGGGSGALNYSVAGAPATMKQQLLQKSDGSFLLALWLDVDSYNKTTKSDIETMVPATINLAQAGNFEVYQPTFSASAQSSGKAQSIPIFVGDQVTIVRIH